MNLEGLNATKDPETKATAAKIYQTMDGSKNKDGPDLGNTESIEIKSGKKNKNKLSEFRPS